MTLKDYKLLERNQVKTIGDTFNKKFAYWKASNYATGVIIGFPVCKFFIECIKIILSLLICFYLSFC